MTSSSDFLTLLFVLSSLGAGPSFMQMSLLVLKLGQFLFIKDWLEIWKFGDWDQLGIPNFAQMSLMKSYWMLQNARVADFTVSELLRENQQGGWSKITPHPTQIWVKE